MTINRQHVSLKLPKLVSNGMVLQRDKDINIWGWGTPGESVTVKFLMNEYSSFVNENGSWKITLPPHKAGGPYNMSIRSGETITLNDILIGEVWVGSGQSNMGFPMNRCLDLYQEDVDLSYNLNIRIFMVPDRFDFNTPHVDLEAGRWETPNPESILHFSALGYFFARALYETYHVPIGFINTSFGGSPVEAWLSEDSLRNFPQHLEIANKFKDNNEIEKIRKSDMEAQNKWYGNVNGNDPGLEIGKEWYRNDVDTSDWQDIKVPGYWFEQGLDDINGVVWFQKEFYVSKEYAGKQARLWVGRIIDSDHVYVNGILVGTIGYQYPPRKYAIAGNLLKEGKNTITVRVVNTSGKGGFIEGKPYGVDIGGKRVVDLTGTWKCKIGVAAEPLQEQTFFQYKPVSLYNGMLSPLINFTIRGFVWYQGESNLTTAKDYPPLIRELIGDWRKKWGLGDLPFLLVQLPNYKEDFSDGVNGWPEIRQAQVETLAVPNTGLAVTLDLGEWNDLHPINKRDVAYRLSLIARKLVYGENLVFSGPIFDKLEKKDKKLEVSFKAGCGNLFIKAGQELKGFEIAGKDKKFVSAKAAIVEDKIEVWNDALDNPTMVRYAYRDNPTESNLVNEIGIPASTFIAELAH